VLIKGGLNDATRALALELASSNVKVSAVAPGIIATPMHSPDEGTRSFLKTLSPQPALARPRTSLTPCST
jgi:NAD(P)-dependent dehydrogenase (short-subunit alcohol dehydrogenase family)